MRNIPRLLPLVILSGAMGFAALAADRVHAPLLSHPWIYHSIEGERTEVVGWLTFALTRPDPTASDACELLWSGSDGATGGCTWLNAQGSIGCGTLKATLTTAAGRLFPPNVSTVYTRCSDREVIERIGNAVFRTRAYHVADGVLELLDDEGAALLTLKAADADSLAETAPPDEVPAISPFYPACMAADWSARGLDTEQEITNLCFCVRNSMASFGLPEEEVPLIARFYAGTATSTDIDAKVPGGFAVLATTVDYCLAGAAPGS